MALQCGSKMPASRSWRSSSEAAAAWDREQEIPARGVGMLVNPVAVTMVITMKMKTWAGLATGALQRIGVSFEAKSSPSPTKRSWQRRDRIDFDIQKVIEMNEMHLCCAFLVWMTHDTVPWQRAATIWAGVSGCTQSQVKLIGAQQYKSRVPRHTQPSP